jgi:hypothetical protein
MEGLIGSVMVFTIETWGILRLVFPVGDGVIPWVGHGQETMI